MEQHDLDRLNKGFQERHDAWKVAVMDHVAPAAFAFVCIPLAMDWFALYLGLSPAPVAVVAVIVIVANIVFMVRTVRRMRRRRLNGTAETMSNMAGIELVYKFDYLP